MIGQPFVDYWAMMAAGIAAASIALRANMLKPSFSAWSPAPWPVWAGLMAVAITLAMGAINISSGDHANPREALSYSVLALSGLVMLWNLHANGRESLASVIQKLAANLDPRVRVLFDRALAAAHLADEDRP